MTETFSISLNPVILEAPETLNAAFSPASAGVAITKGYATSIDTNGDLVVTPNATTFVAGHVITPLDNSTGKVVIVTNWKAILYVKAKGGTINAGTLVSLNGSSSDGLNEVVASATGNMVYGLVLEGGVVDAHIKIAVVPTFKF